MKKNYFFISFLIAIVSLVACTNDDVEDVPYTTGVIKFEYQKSTLINGLSKSKDTIISFTSIGNNPNETDLYGFSSPSTPWVIMQRLNPNDFTNRSIIFFTGTNLNLLTMPYTFSPYDEKSAQINYVVDEKIMTDDTGQQFAVNNTYAAATYSENFELIILSKENNRLRGIFAGELKNQDGLIINIKNGIFDIQIVEK
ncbi:hypothetical protein [Gelidibacter japonicus]|jgi:hypothetical protein|uniref:hypothetical protein n=1 Tax=Gelidibacter japonicus TaxID=1962232 RepID=UPI002AFEB2C3|nr:hypothetical protein [Gelidibacter japonicus]